MTNDDLPQLCGQELKINKFVNHQINTRSTNIKLDLSNINAGFAYALQMHQPTTSAGKNGQLISHLKYMFEHIS